MEAFDAKFNETRHDCELYLDNGSQQFAINPNAVVSLTIHNTLSEWAAKGVLVFYFYPEAGNGVYSSETGQYSSAQTGIRSSNISTPYQFANDGTDLLRVRINPKLDGKGKDDFTIQDKKHWTLSHLFSVYNIEDVDLPPGAQNAASADIKCLKLYFWDSWYQKLLTNQLEYSTALSENADVDGDKSTGLYSNYGQVSTGQAIKEILTRGLEGTGQNIFGPDDTWEDGASKLFFTAPAGYSAQESLQYIFNQHLSSKTGNDDIQDVSLLVKERGPSYNDLGYFALRPLQYFFEKSTNGSNPGELQAEHFFLQSYTSSSDKNPTKRFRAPISNSDSDTVDVKLSKYNIITNYRYVDNSAVTNEQAFRTSPVYSFDYKNRKMRLDFANNTVYKAKDYISQQYIDKVYKKGSGNDLFLMNLNEDKQTKNIEPAFSLYGDDNDDDKKLRQLPGIQKLLNLGVFQNAAVNFRTLGLTSREPGCFVAIDKTEGVTSGDFEDKFFGQWFVLDVKHVFEAGAYYNDITAVKLHRYQSKGSR
jgi:hypothetical protein